MCDGLVTHYERPVDFLRRAKACLSLRECENSRVLGHAIGEAEATDSTSRYFTVETSTEILGAAALTADGLLEMSVMTCEAAEALWSLVDGLAEQHS